MCIVASPALGERKSDKVSFAFTHCVLPERKEENHSNDVGDTPAHDNLISKPVMETRSYALLKFKFAACTCSP